jgi:hypothetical protein
MSASPQKATSRSKCDPLKESLNVGQDGRADISLRDT